MTNDLWWRWPNGKQYKMLQSSHQDVRESQEALSPAVKGLQYSKHMMTPKNDRCIKLEQPINQTNYLWRNGSMQQSMTWPCTQVPGYQKRRAIRWTTGNVMRNMFLSKDTLTNEWRSICHKRHHTLPMVGAGCGKRKELHPSCQLYACTRYKKRREKKRELIEYGVPW